MCSLSFAAEIDALPAGSLVGIDGVDGSGKSIFADELVALFERPHPVLRLDHFLNPSEVRHDRGRASSVGFWLDTYDHPRFRTAVGQARTEADLVIVEGMFLHRDELAGMWDLSVFLDVSFTETARRMSLRNGSNPDPESAAMRRYVDGQRRSFAAARPWDRATHVIDNTTPSMRRVIEPGLSSAASDAGVTARGA